MAKDFGDSEIKKNVSKVFKKNLLDEVQKFQTSKKALKVAAAAGKYALIGAATTAGGIGVYDLSKKLGLVRKMRL